MHLDKCIELVVRKYTVQSSYKMWLVVSLPIHVAIILLQKFLFWQISQTKLWKLNWIILFILFISLKSSFILKTGSKYENHSDFARLISYVHHDLLVYAIDALRNDYLNKIKKRYLSVNASHTMIKCSS